MCTARWPYCGPSSIATRRRPANSPNATCASSRTRSRRCSEACRTFRCDSLNTGPHGPVNMPIGQGSGRTDMDRGIRPLNVTLLTLLVVATISGVVAFGGGFSGPARWVIAVHGAAGLGLLLLAPAKIRLARRGLRRPGRSRKVISLTFTVPVLAAIGRGVLHAVGGWRPYLGLLPMQLHVGAAVGAVALLIAHVVMHHRSARRRWRRVLRRGDPTRRRALVGTGVVAGSAALLVIA